MTENTFTGQLIKDPNIYFKCNITEPLFKNYKNRDIFKAVKTCIEKDIEPNIQSLPTVSDKIDVGHMAKISSVPSTANWKHYYDILVEELRQRELKKISLELGYRVEQNNYSSDILEYLETETTNIRQGHDRRKIEKASETICDTFDYIKERIRLQGEYPGIRSGIMNLDRFTLGFQNGLMYVIGGRPSQGKTAAMCSFVYESAIVNEIPTGVISAESSAVQIQLRLISQGAHISSQVMLAGQVKPDKMNDIEITSTKIHDAPLYMYDEPNPQIGDVISQCRRMVSVYGCKIIFIDYLQYIEYNETNMEEHLRIAAVSKRLKSLSRDLNIPIVACAQLNRDSEGRRPMMKDISGSTQIERDADCIVMIYHQKDGDKLDSWLLVEKNRDGATGDAAVYFQKEYVTFKDRISESY